MNELLAHHPAMRELRQLVAELSLVSHAPIQGYDFAPSEVGRGQRNRTSDRKAPIPHLGAHRPKDGDTRTPRGGDLERKPRAPKGPRVEGDAQSEKAWDEYEAELAAWRACYHRRTPTYFKNQLERCETEYRLRLLVDEARETLEAWRRTPIPQGQEPQPGDPQWKRYIAESKESAESLAARFWNPATRKPYGKRYINKIRQEYRERRAA